MKAMLNILLLNVSLDLRINRFGSDSIRCKIQCQCVRGVTSGD